MPIIYQKITYFKKNVLPLIDLLRVFVILYLINNLPIMKTSIQMSYCLLMFLTIVGSSAQVGIGTTTPRGALEIYSSTNGFVTPRVALSSVTESAPVVNPQTAEAPLTGTIVYNTATAGTSPNEVSPGYYFWNGSLWLKIAAENTAYNFIDDLRVPLDKGSSAASLEYFSGSTGPQIWVFRNNASVEAMSFTVQLPHNWKQGTTIYPHIHWIPRANGTGNVQWNLDYTWVDIDGTFSATTTISGIATGPFTKDNHLLTNIGTGLVGTDKSYSSVLICRIWRDSSIGTDTYNGDAGGLTMDFHVFLRNPFAENPD